MLPEPAKAREDGEICLVHSELHRFMNTQLEMQELQLAKAKRHIHCLMALFCDWFGEMLSIYAEPHGSPVWPQSPQNLPRIVWGHPHHHYTVGCRQTRKYLRVLLFELLSGSPKGSIRMSKSTREPPLILSQEL